MHDLVFANSKYQVIFKILRKTCSMLLANDFVLKNMLVMHHQAAKQHLPEGPAKFWNLQFSKCSKLSPAKKSLTIMVS